MLSEELIGKLKKDPYFQQFVEYIASKIEELDSIGGLDALTNKRAGEEAKARWLARNKLYEILKPVVEPVGRKKPTQEQIDKAKNKFGV